MKTVLFFTASYPYAPGEQFIEDEIGFWAKTSEIRLIIVPFLANGETRQVPAGIDVDLILAKRTRYWHVIQATLKAVTSPVFWKEIWSLRSRKTNYIVCCAIALKAAISLYKTESAILLLIKRFKKIDLAYCYWNDTQSYAAILLKRRCLITEVVSRIHGYDLYPNRRRFNYMPLKSQFIGDFDRIYPVSAQGARTLSSVYGASEDQIRIGRLGVPIPDSTCKPSREGALALISVSSCIPVKRIDKIISAVFEVSGQLQDLKITWTHIGDGPLLSQLKAMSSELLTAANIEFEFKGALANQDVRNLLSNSNFDLFINSSESEGVPVSIMEALSYGIPCIAPDIGGISELIDYECGHLLSANPTVTEISQAIILLRESCKASVVREAARQRVNLSYSANTNYKQFVEEIA
jgi:glycosyltransferase involved in cell wall biosynthesis